MIEILFIALGGALGALARYGLASWVQNLSHSGEFPWGTLSVNLIGAFLIGIIWAIAERFAIPLYARQFMFAGLLGAFTTFSTFCLENFNLFRVGDWKFALINIGVSNVFGLVLIAVGFMLTGWCFSFLRT